MRKFLMSAFFLIFVGFSHANSFSVAYSPFSQVAPISMEYTLDYSERFGVTPGLVFDVPNFAEETFSVVVGPSLAVSYAILRSHEDYEIRAVFRAAGIFSFEDEFAFDSVAHLGLALRDFSGGVLEPVFEAGGYVSQEFDYGVYVRFGVAR